MRLNSDPYFGKPFQLEGTSPEQWQPTIHWQFKELDPIYCQKLSINTCRYVAWIGNTKVNTSNIN